MDGQGRSLGLGVLAGLCLTLMSTAAQGATPVDWDTGTTGTAALTNVVMANIANSTIDSSWDLSGPDFSAAPLSVNQEALDYTQGSSAWTASFSQPVSEILVYMVFWRSGTYTFDQTPTLLSGSGGIVSGNQFTVPSNFASGILQFLGSFSSLSVDDPGACCSHQVLTLAVTPAMVPVKTRSWGRIKSIYNSDRD